MLVSGGIAPADGVSDADPDGGEDHAYFQALEEIFVQLRGSPLVLSPADWRVAQRWHRQGVPLEVARRAMEEVFEKRRERGAKGKISSLRYLAPAVEALWADLRELAAPGDRDEGGEVDLAPRLGALAAALPAELPGCAELAARVTALAGDSEEVERALAGLDREMLETAERELGDERRQEVEAGVQRTLGTLAGRLDPQDLEAARTRLARQILRQRLGLPVLSLFAPEAQPRSET